MSEGKNSKRANGKDGGFVTTKFDPLKNGVSEWTLRDELDDFRELAADILKSFGKLDDEQCQRAKQGDIADILKLRLTDNDPKVCSFAKAMLNGIHSVNCMSGLDSTRTELLLIAKLVNVAYFLGIGQYEDELMKGFGTKAGIKNGNDAKSKKSAEVGRLAQELADKVWETHPRFNKLQVAEKIRIPLSGLLNEQYKEVGEKIFYSAKTIAKRIKKKK